MRVAALLVLSVLIAIPTFSQTNNVGLGDSFPPTSQPINATDIASWTTWDASNVGPLLPNEPINSFGQIDKYLVPAPAVNDIVMIHIVNSTDRKLGPVIAISDSHWFLYQKDKNGLFHQLLKKAKGAKTDAAGVMMGTAPTLYGAKTGYIITLSRLLLDPSRTAITGPPYPATPPTLNYTVTPTQGTAANLAALQALVGAVLNITTAAAAAPAAVAPHVALPLPALKYVLAAQATRINQNALKPPYTLAIAGTPISTAAGDDGTCSNVTAKTTCPMSQTISVNDVEHWGIGVNIVAYGPVERSYSLSSSGVVGVNSTRHMALYGVFDYIPAGTNHVWVPYLQAGVPLSGAVLHLPYVGISQPLPFTSKFIPLSVYGGYGFMKQTKLDGLAVGSTATQAQFTAASKTDWAKKPIYGIEVQVSAIVNKIKSSVGGSGGGN
ncbi:MAG: hypothetical protein JWQ49_2379 [Edaphobacter sp.]|nr:hypothetical protein [Edaphobacter sp.]